MFAKIPKTLDILQTKCELIFEPTRKRKTLVDELTNDAGTDKAGIDKNWYYIIIQNPGTSTEQYVGFNDSKTDEKFIPSFKTKEQAKQCFALMPKDLFNGTYDTQAVIDDDLFEIAKKNDHRLYLLDEKGTILEYLNEEQE